MSVPTWVYQSQRVAVMVITVLIIIPAIVGLFFVLHIAEYVVEREQRTDHRKLNVEILKAVILAALVYTILANFIGFLGAWTQSVSLTITHTILCCFEVLGVVVTIGYLRADLPNTWAVNVITIMSTMINGLWLVMCGLLCENMSKLKKDRIKKNNLRGRLAA